MSNDTVILEMDREVKDSIEFFSRSLMMLTKSARIYPPEHPAITSLIERATKWAPPDGSNSAEFGVTRNELVFQGRFYGGRNTRTTDLAEFLHEKKIKKLKVTIPIGLTEVVSFARSLAAQDLEGAELVQALNGQGLRSFDLEALDLSKLHGQMTEERPDTIADSEHRGRQAWLWLQAENSTPDQISQSLTVDELWHDGTKDNDSAHELGYMLAGLGKRLEQGMEMLSDVQREKVLARLGAVGEKVSSEELADILSHCPDPAIFAGEGMVALVGDIESDKLVDLMAALTASEGVKSERLARICKQFVSGKNEEELFDQVKNRLSSSDHRGYAVSVWKSVEEFLLNFNEEHFMDDDYNLMLGRMAANSQSQYPDLPTLDFEEKADRYLDTLHVELAVHGETKDWDRLHGRLREHIENRDATSAVFLAGRINEYSPEAFSGDLDFFHSFIYAALDGAHALDVQSRRTLKTIILEHDGIITKYLLKRLEESEKIASRKLAVEIIAALPESYTPQLISRARVGPWYLTRNLIIALGARGETRVIPYLKSCLASDNEKIRREALRSLARLGGEGYEIVSNFAGNELHSAEEREIARLALVRQSQ